jgi:hypothetical protein
VELRKVTRSPMVEIYHALDGVRKVRQAAAGPIAGVVRERQRVGRRPRGGQHLADRLAILFGGRQMKLGIRCWWVSTVKVTSSSSSVFLRQRCAWSTP